MITFFTIPKAFEGRIGTIQRNALRSWAQVAPGVQVLALGEMDPGIDAEQIPDIARNEHGTPLLDDAFRIAAARARHDVLCYANADVLLPPSLADAVRTTIPSAPFLIVGECWNVRIGEELQTVPWRTSAKKRGADAIDYFVFSRGLFEDLPPFAVGRPAWDNWLVWRARSGGATVVDATWGVHALHQDHDYAHLGGLGEMRTGTEAIENRRLAGGGRQRLYSRFDATHRLVGGRLLPNPLGVAHLGETIRRAWAKASYTTGVRRT